MRVTASKVGLLSYCQWWAKPEAKWTYTTSSAADRGTRFHKAIAAYVEHGKHPSLLGPDWVADDIAEELDQAIDWLLAFSPVAPIKLETEIAFAWDPVTDTAEVIGGDRDYSKANGRLCGTADLVLVATMDGKPIAVMVWDWKTGDGTGAGPQLRMLGLAAARAFGVESATVAALEVRKSGVTEVAREELDAFALAGVAGELAEHLAAIATAEPQPGSHCGELYCPARLSCPLGNEATAQVVDVIPADALVPAKRFKLTDPIKTPEHAIWAIDVIRLVSAKLDAIKDEIKSKVPAEGWAADDGRVLRETKATIEAFDKHKAQALLKELGATDEQLGGCFYTFEKSNGLRVSGGATKPRTKRSKAA